MNVLTNEDENENTSDEDRKPLALGRIVESLPNGKRARLLLNF
jgi:hypothetical protein